MTISYPPSPLSAPSGTTGTFGVPYTGSRYVWRVPDGITKIAVRAAGGIGSGNESGGFGGETDAIVPVTPGQYVVAIAGASGANGGFGGGGDDQSGPPFPAGVGGGASDIRVGGNALADRVVVAGGGGGSGSDIFGSNKGLGGDGGGLEGVAGVDGGNWFGHDGAGGSGGTQTAGGSGGSAAGTFGNGGRNDVVGEGGGGWYGGAAGGIDTSTGGGGGGSATSSPAPFTRTSSRAQTRPTAGSGSQPTSAALSRCPGGAG